MRVAGIVNVLAYGSAEMIAAAWLHDTIEDTDTTKEELQCHFGKFVSHMVAELTNPSKQYPELRRVQRKQMDREHLEGVSDEAKTIKLADRIDNLRDFGIDPLVPQDFRKLYLEESRQLLGVLYGACPVLHATLRDMITRQTKAAT